MKNRNNKMQEMKTKYQIAGAIFFLCVLVAILCGGLALKQVSAASAAERTTVTRTTVKTVTAKTDKQYYDVPLSEELQDYIFSVSKQYGVPSDVIVAVIQQESNFDQYAVGGCGEQGLMQIHPCNFDTLSSELGVTDLFDAKQNIRSGAYLLSSFIDRYDTELALMCYNCGEYGATSLWEQGIYTTKYTERVTEIISELEYRR